MRLFLPLFALLALAASPDYISASRKVKRIESGKSPAKSRISFPPAEISAFLSAKAAEKFPGAVRNPSVQLGPGTVAGKAMVDFLKLSHSQGEEPGIILSHLLQGARPVEVFVRVHSLPGGRGQVDLERVTVSGIAISGAALDFLLRHFLLHYYPDAKIGTPFEWGYRIEKMELSAAGLRVTIHE
ncbi:MAG: hypothetical protein JJE04_18710 [Acidobacteriia bacterium]|nr:hypothetical protein [Terriglobia bacterium]